MDTDSDAVVPESRTRAGFTRLRLHAARIRCAACVCVCFGAAPTRAIAAGETRALLAWDGPKLVVGIVACVLALLAVDFISGFVHWCEDTFGSESTPILGRWIIAPNVVHHHDATAFVAKGWWASSWDWILVGLVVLVVAAITGHLGPYVVLFTMAGSSANQIHKWNHAPARAPLAVRALWTSGVLQRPAHHAPHHGGDKNTAYCVVTPFVNPVLDRLRFWRGLERIVVPFTGAPRREDLCALWPKNKS